MSLPSIVIGAAAGDHVAITVRQHEHREATDSWERGWLRATVRIVAGAFHGAYDALLRVEEIARLRTSLAQLHAELTGKARFETMEDWLRMDLEGDGRGHFVATCEAREQPGTGCMLRFELRLDQTELLPVLASLDAVLAAFPLEGSTIR